MAGERSVDHSAERNNFTPLRLLLATLVMLYHFKVLTGGSGEHWPMVYPDFAVEGFYVISGILIYESFDRRPDRTSFFIKRLFRLYPLYIFMIAVQTVVLLSLQTGSIVEHLGEAGQYFAANAVFLNFAKRSIGDALLGARDAGINPSLWTLKVEVAFYVLVPLIWLGVRRFRSHWLVAAFAASLIYTTVLRETGHMSLAKQIPGAMMYFIIGILICLHRDTLRRLPHAAIWAVAAIGFALITAIQMGLGPFAAEPWRIAFPFAVAPVIFAAAYALPPLGLKRDFSYGVYLIHGPVIQSFVVLSLIGFTAGSLAAVIALVAILALAAERFIERPFIRFGHHLARALAAPVPPSSVSSSDDALRRLS